MSDPLGPELDWAAPNSGDGPAPAAPAGGDGPIPVTAGKEPHNAPVKSTTSKRTRSLLEWGAVVLVALLAALGIRQWVFQPFWIPSGSMENTLDIGDRVLVNKLSYHLHPIHRGDVIVFSLPRSWNLGASVKDLIKRVIAVPGDTVYIHDCSVWVNDKKLNEPYTEGRCTEPATAVLDPTGSGRFTVPAKELFVMGDNRTGSSDSRFNGYVPESDVVGRAFVLIWPVGRWRWL